jgi:heterodisulfide reductase subunit B
MNGIPYFPGCSLKDTASGFEDSAFYVMETLGHPLVELERWNCCGTVYSLTADDLMHHVASVRNFVRVREMGAEEVVALCSMCYNTLARVARRIDGDEEALDKINAFMDREEDYEGGVAVVHLLEVLRDRIGSDAIADATTRPLDGLAVAPYYGCTLVRPKDVSVDDTERPTVMADVLEAAGATPIQFPFATECCGTYQVVDRPELSLERSHRVLRSAASAGANVVATACPLCQHNLEQAQRSFGEVEGLTVAYFTELLAAALGAEPDRLPQNVRSILETHVTIEGGA